MSSVAFRETTKPYLRSDQVESFGQEARRLRDTLNAPPHIRNQVQDASNMRAQLQRLDKVLETSTPRPYQGQERDLARARNAELESEIKAGMPTAEEMRRAPPGAVDKQLNWDRTKKSLVLEWKNIQRRLHATECEGGPMETVRDIANVERLRSKGLSQSMDMAGAQIPGRDFIMPANPTPMAILSDHDLERLKAALPELHAKVATLSNEDRAKIKAILTGTAEALPKAAQPRARKVRKPMSAEARQRLSEHMKALNARKRAEGGNGA